MICPHCGEEENFHFNYDYTQKHTPIIDVLCNNCGEFFNSKEQQKKLIAETKKLIAEIMEADAKDGLYNQECCTPEEGVLVLSEAFQETIEFYTLIIRSQKYKMLLAIQKKPKETIYFKDQEVSPEKLIEILEKAEIS
jgi:hypothetical protein